MVNIIVDEITIICGYAIDERIEKSVSCMKEVEPELNIREDPHPP